VAGAIQKQAKRWTYEEYYLLEDDGRYEIIDGKLLMAPAPDVWHQDWIGNLHFFLRQFLARKEMGRLFLSPIDVVLDAENTVQPDLVFVAKANKGIIQKRAIFGTPDLVVEFVSASGVRRDPYVKKELYARFGVKEYWIGDPANRSLEILVLKDGDYRLHGAAEEKGELTSVVLGGLRFDLGEICPQQGRRAPKLKWRMGNL
jgi:Uma2 family endonuclease